MDQKKTLENRDIMGFLECLGDWVTCLQCSVNQERPDAILHLLVNGVQKKIGIEHTGYLVDALHGDRSKGMRLYDLWQNVTESIGCRLSYSPELRHVEGLVSFKKDVELPDECPQQLADFAEPLAAELIALAKVAALKEGERMMYKRIRKYERRTDWMAELPARYPLLADCVEAIRLYGRKHVVLTWRCSNASTAHVGLSRRHIAKIIEAKNVKSAKYAWCDVDERWLLIAAPGDPVFKTADRHPEWFEWHCPEIKAACQATRFDHIYFWGGRYGWCKEIYPGGKLYRINES